MEWEKAKVDGRRGRRRRTTDELRCLLPSFSFSNLHSHTYTLPCIISPTLFLHSFHSHHGATPPPSPSTLTLAARNVLSLPISPLADSLSPLPSFSSLLLVVGPNSTEPQDADAEERVRTGSSSEAADGQEDCRSGQSSSFLPSFRLVSVVVRAVVPVGAQKQMFSEEGSCISFLHEWEGREGGRDVGRKGSVEMELSSTCGSTSWRSP